jgi:hypothetical protein
MREYIRRQTVFNKNSDREKRIWDWVVSSTNEFQDQNYAAFVRDKLEWCMRQPGVMRDAEPAFIREESNTADKRWSKLI